MRLRRDQYIRQCAISESFDGTILHRILPAIAYSRCMARRFAYVIS